MSTRILSLFVFTLLFCRSVQAQVNLSCPSGGQVTFILAGSNGSCLTTAPTEGTVYYAIGGNCGSATNNLINVQTSCGCCPIENGDCIKYVNTNTSASSDVFVIGGITYNVAIGSQSPTVTEHPASQIKCAGSSVTFTSVATGTPAPSSQWEVSTNNGSSWSNAAGGNATGVLTFTTTASQDQYQYRAVWTNSAGSATSDPATLTVGSTPTINTHPLTQSVCYSYPVTLSVAATAPGSIPITYQWRVEGDDIPGAQSSTYLISEVNETTGNKNYDVVVTSCALSVTSNAAYITLLPAPTISLSTTPNYIHSSDHSLKLVSADVSSVGGCAPLLTLYSVTSSEADNGVMTGDLPSDIVADSIGEVPAEEAIQLRAEAGNNGRIYTLIYRLTDGAAFTTYDTIRVPAITLNSKIGSGPQSSSITLNDPEPLTGASTDIVFALSGTCATRVSLYNLSGTWIADIFESAFSSGETVSWNGTLPGGALVPNGLYLIGIKSCDGSKTTVLSIDR